MGESDLPIHVALERTGQNMTWPMRSLPLRIVLRPLLPFAVAFLLLAAPVLADDLQGLPVQEIRFQSQAGLDQQRFRELLAIKSSEPYEQEKIRQSIERLYATGRFFDIQVEAERNGGGLTRELLAWWHRTWEVRSEIVQVNVPLVLAMAKRTRLNSIDFNELVSEGNMALLRSVDKFDCSRGFKFSTYSCRAILKSFSRVAMRVSRYRGRFPTEFDPALEQDTYLEDKRQDVELDCVDELKAILLRNQADLSEIEQTVIRERFALSSLSPESTSPKTLEEVGLIIGVTKERVRQIQNKALQKIKQALEDRYLAA